MNTGRHIGGAKIWVWRERDWDVDTLTAHEQVHLRSPRLLFDFVTIIRLRFLHQFIRFHYFITHWKNNSLSCPDRQCSSLCSRTRVGSLKVDCTVGSGHHQFTLVLHGIQQCSRTVVCSLCGTGGFEDSYIQHPYYHTHHIHHHQSSMVYIYTYYFSYPGMNEILNMTWYRNNLVRISPDSRWRHRHHRS